MTYGRCVEEQVRALDRLTTQMFADRDERVVLALESIEKRLDLLNEFRRQSADESAKYAVREVVDASHTALSDRISDNAKAISNLQGRALALAGAGAVIGGMVTSLMVGVFA